MFFFITQKHKNRFVLIYANYNFYTPKKHTKKSKSKIKFIKSNKKKQAEEASWKIEKHRRRMCSFSKFKQRSVLCVFFYFIFLIIKLYILYFFMARAIPYGVCLI